MKFNALDRHKYINLIEFTLENNSFTKAQACEACGLSQTEFDFVRDDFFVLSAAQAQSVQSHELYDWKLSPQSFFNYLQFLEFKHAVDSAKKAQWTAVAAIVITGLLAIVSIWATISTG